MLTRTILIAVALVVTYFLTWPSPVRPVAWTPSPSPGFSGAFATNALLGDVTLLAKGTAIGPETVALGPDGWLYAGVSDGRILRIDPDTGSSETYADTGGRPNGLAFDADGRLIVGDSFRGLLAIDQHGQVIQLVTEVDGLPLIFTDGLDIANDGTVWFTDGSQRFPDGQGTYEFLEGSATGRLISYDPKTGVARTRLGGLRFANGVALGPGDAFVLVNESLGYRTRRLWLAGDRSGEVDTFFDNYPAAPDNITFNGRDLFWVAFFMPRDPLFDSVHPYPFLKKILSRVPLALMPGPESKLAFAVALSPDGEVVYNLQDRSGRYHSTTSAVEIGGALYLGSIASDAIGKLSLLQLPRVRPRGSWTDNTRSENDP
jgi:sugar lactone lactonase YvrE